VTAAADRRAANALVVAAAAAVSFQQAGKATRDALFLSTFGVAALPRMFIVAAVVSAALTISLSRLLIRTGPGRLVPALFGVSGILLLGEWGLAAVARPAAVILFFLHYAALGALLASGLWATVTERFDPWTARSSVGRIATGASVGGLLGGFLPERIGAGPGLDAMLPLLAVLHLAAGCLLLAGRGPGQPAPSVTLAEPAPTRSAREVFGGSAYLRGMVWLVALAAAAEGVLEYVFMVGVSGAVPAGDALLRAFAIFYTGTALLTILLQATLLRPLLRQVGVSQTAAMLPGGVVVGALAGLAIPSVGMLVAARGVQVILRNSLFRGAWELLFTPVTAEDKRASKLLLDVGATRAGDVAGGALVQAALSAGLAGPRFLLGITALLGLAGFRVARQLHRGYVGELERSLQFRAAPLPGSVPDRPTTLLHSFGGFDLGDIRPRVPESPVPEGEAAASAPAETPAPLSRQAALASADPQVVRAALGEGPLEPELVGPVVGLLAWDEVAPEATRALLTVASAAAPELLARLLDPEEDFAIRRRLVRVVGQEPGQAVFEGLHRALDDPRFEVRYRAGRAMTMRRVAEPALEPDRGRILATVLREMAVDRAVWESRRLLDQADDGWSPMESEVLRDRASRSLEHVFNLLSLLLAPEPLRIAFHGLHTADPQLRGTALEYLETVLPYPVRERLWPFLEADGDARPRGRSPEAVVNELLASKESILLALAVARERGGGVP